MPERRETRQRESRSKGEGVVSSHAIIPFSALSSFSYFLFYDVVFFVTDDTSRSVLLFMNSCNKIINVFMVRDYSLSLLLLPL